LRVYYFPHFEDTYPEVAEAIDPESRVLAGKVFVAYGSRLRLVLQFWPRLMAFGIKILRTVVRDRPQAFVVWTHLVLVPLAMVRTVRLVRNPRAVLFGFIFTDRASRTLNWLRVRYFRWLLKRVDLVIVHSSREAQDYARRFRLDDKFVFVPCGVRDPLVTVDAQPAPAGPRVVCGGKSNRDYDLLLAAAAELAVPVDVLSDDAALAHRPLPPNVTVYASCYMREFRTKLAQATVVLLPLKSADFSAGQLVLIEAMGLARPVVITRAAGTLDYVDAGRTAEFVEAGDVAGAVATVRGLLVDERRRADLGAAAREAFMERYEIRAVFRQLHEVIAACVPGESPERTRRGAADWRPQSAPAEV
jgi:glycosyltransferase involved in cell wall biosynthesis